MVYTKRLTGTTLLGALAGVLCWQGGASVGIDYTPAMIAGTVLNRAFIGFAIGISALRWPYLAHGALIGLLGSLPMAVFSADLRGAIMLSLYGVLWGLLIELVATKALTAPMR
jgi:hypothetical protein